MPCEGSDGRPYLLKFFIPPMEGRFYPAGVRLEDYPRREGAFYRYLDTIDPERVQLPAPRTVLIDTQDPPRWIVLDRIDVAVGPMEEVLGADHVFALMAKLQSLPIERLLGRRHLPLNHWDPVGYAERARMMYDPVLFVVGEQRWRRLEEFYREATRWTDSRRPVLVHGDYTDQNLLVRADGEPFLVDFERIGIGSSDHDFAWFWIHARRGQDWKVRLLGRYLGSRVGSDRIRCEWGIRAALVYLALRRLRFGYLMHGAEDPLLAQNLGLFDAALAGGRDFFPV